MHNYIYLSIEIRRHDVVKNADGTITEPIWESDNFIQDRFVWNSDSRAAKLFSILDGMNDNDGIEHVPLRGFPDDCSFPIFNNYCNIILEDDEEFFLPNCIYRSKVEKRLANGECKTYHRFGKEYITDPEKLSANWCTTKEMEDAVNRAFRNDDGSYADGCESWIALVGMMKGYEMPGRYECRAVYWFYEIL